MNATIVKRYAVLQESKRIFKVIESVWSVHGIQTFSVLPEKYRYEYEANRRARYLMEKQEERKG